MAATLGEVDRDTRCEDAACWQRDTCKRFLPDGPVLVNAQVAGSLRSRWQDQASVCLHYIEKGAVS